MTAQCPIDPIDLEGPAPAPAGARGSRAERREAPWPDPLAEDAYHGLAGQIIRRIAPQTEADPAALLVQLLAAFGNAVGTRPHYLADGSRHACKLFVAIVGATSKGRKGTSWGRVREVFAFTDEPWTKRITSGLSSGEGLIWQIRDPIYKTKTNTKGEVEDELVDEGVSDKRVLVFEAELASTMAVMARPGNTLSAIIRGAWDGSDLRMLTKNSSAQSTGAHVSILGHVTRDELLRNLNRTELGNGFANRFLWVCAKRAQVLPFGGEAVDHWASAASLREALQFARNTDEIKLGADARAIWAAVYPDLSDGRPGVLGTVTGRAEAQVVRIAMVYALLDSRSEVGAAHLRAALAVWNYSFASASWIWGDALGDPTADELLDLLRAHPPPLGRTGTQVRDHFGRHHSAEVARAKAVLLANRLAYFVSEPSTGGAPPQRWFAGSATEATQATKGGEP
jgi:hypothetical protein